MYGIPHKNEKKQTRATKISCLLRYRSIQGFHPSVREVMKTSTPANCHDIIESKYVKYFKLC